jgi:hypothetical protein
VRNENKILEEKSIRTVHNAQTTAAMREAETISRDPNIKGHRDLDVLFKELETEP